MRTLIVNLFWVVVTGVSFYRLLHTVDMKERVLGVIITFMFAILSFYLIFEKRIKSSGTLGKTNASGVRRDLLPDYGLILMLVAVIGTVFWLYPTDNNILIAIRYFVTAVFLIGLIAIGIQMFLLIVRKDSNSGRNSKPQA